MLNKVNFAISFTMHWNRLLGKTSLILACLIGAIFSSFDARAISCADLLSSISRDDEGPKRTELVPVGGELPAKVEAAKTERTRSAEKIAFEKEMEEYRARRKVIEESSPAYVKDSGPIFFTYTVEGLSIAFEHGPYESGRQNLSRFRLKYDPKKFNRGSLIRRTFGNEALDFDLKDVRWVSSTHMAGFEGEFIDVYLKDGPSVSSRDQNGPLMMISRDTGRILLYPPDPTPEMARMGITQFALGLWSETQQRFGKGKISGQWLTSKDGIAWDVSANSASEN